MPARLGPRFALEAVFLIALAVAMGLADLSATAIIAVMAVAWFLVAIVEWLASRSAARDAPHWVMPSPSAAARWDESAVDEDTELVPPPHADARLTEAEAAEAVPEAQSEVADETPPADEVEGPAEEADAVDEQPRKRWFRRRVGSAQ
jgi:hypothetical protein